MNHPRKRLCSNFKILNWKSLILIVVVTMYSTQFGMWLGKDSYPIEYGGDFLAFWSAGKIADEKGYAEIYDLENLSSVQLQALNERGLYENPAGPLFSPFPAPYLSVYILPFQLLSKVDVRVSFWIWTILNLAILIWYLAFFLRRTHPGNGTAFSSLTILILVLFSFPVFTNFINGQLNVLLLICTGEFIRFALNKKPFLSGLWLGGLLLKPQLLFLIIPIILLMRYWKALLGFIVSSAVIILTSLLLSGFTGMNALINLLTHWGEGNSVTAPEAMINWRMIGVYLNTYLNTSFGWIVTGAGMILTVLAIYWLLKHIPAYGNPGWVVTMLGVFAGTLAVTWHAHYHMAMVLIPFLIYLSVYKMLPEKIIYLWVGLTPIAWIGIGILNPIVLLIAKIDLNDYYGTVIAFSGFVVNLAVLYAAVQFSYHPSLQRIPISEG